MNLIKTFIILSVAAVSKVLSVQVCGRRLADMLDFVCDGRGFNWINPDGLDWIVLDGLPSISKRSASQYLSQTSGSRQRRGVVTECCWKACSLGEMENYCAAPPGTYLDNPTNGPITEEVANEISESASQSNLTNSVSTASPQPIHTTPTPQPISPTPQPTSPRTPHPLPNLAILFAGSVFGSPRNQGRHSFANIPFFYLQPVNPTRTPGVV